MRWSMKISKLDKMNDTDEFFCRMVDQTLHKKVFLYGFADLVTFTDEIRNGKLLFLCAVKGC